MPISGNHTPFKLAFVGWYYLRLKVSVIHNTPGRVIKLLMFLSATFAAGHQGDESFQFQATSLRDMAIVVNYAGLEY